MSSTKKYKLFAAAGGNQPCAFFASPAGCRNGDKCKFLHSTAPVVTQEEAASNSVVSTEESSSEDESHSEPTPKPTNKKKPVVAESNDNSKQNKKRKKNSEADNSQVFAKPKTNAVLAAEPPNKKIKNNNNNIQAAPKTEDSSKSNNKKQKKQKQKTIAAAPVDFRSLQLPIAAFPGMPQDEPSVKKEKAMKEEVAPLPPTPKLEPLAPKKKKYPVPSCEAGKKWKDLVVKTQQHDDFERTFDFQKYKEQGIPGDLWVESKPFGDWCADFPQAIAMDCEMCETQDPVSNVKNPNALCRVSIVNADVDSSEFGSVLLDTLVKPTWNVSDYRTWVNGIDKTHLEKVEFTLRHAQAFLMALCSKETVIMGHAVHNDLAALRMEHYCVADSAMLFQAKDSPTATVSLKDLARTCLDKEMPSIHDSVNDARTALNCLDHYREREGKVELIERTYSDKKGGSLSSSKVGHQLFVHRIPKMCKPDHLSKMFLEHTSVQPEDVDEIDFTGNSGKTLVNFKSPRHAGLAFATLAGEGEADKSGRMQKKVYLRNGDYVRVRKMLFERDHVFPDGRKMGSPNP